MVMRAKRGPRSKPTDVPPPKGALDRIDRRMLHLLQEDGRISNTELAERVGLSESPCLRRVRRLEAEGYIRKYTAVLDAAKLGLQVSIFVHVSITESTSAAIAAFRAAVMQVPEIIACHAVSGDEDFLLVILARDLEGYKRFNNEVLLHLPHVSKKISSFSLDTIKEFGLLPLELIPEFRADISALRR